MLPALPGHARSGSGSGAGNQDNGAAAATTSGANTHNQASPKDLAAYISNVKSLEAFLLRVLKVARRIQPQDLNAFIVDALHTDERSLKVHVATTTAKLTAQEQRRYNVEVVDPLLSSMMPLFVLEQPTDPKAWMMQYLRSIRNDSGSRNASSSGRGDNDGSGGTAGRHEGGGDGASSPQRQGGPSRVQLTPLSSPSSASQSQPALEGTRSAADDRQGVAPSTPGSRQASRRGRRGGSAGVAGDAAAPASFDDHLKPHIAVAPPHSELLLITQSLMLCKTDLFTGGGAGAGEAAAATGPAGVFDERSSITTEKKKVAQPQLDFGSINPFFMQNRCVLACHLVVCSANTNTNTAINQHRSTTTPLNQPPHTQHLTSTASAKTATA